MLTMSSLPLTPNLPKSPYCKLLRVVEPGVEDKVGLSNICKMKRKRGVRYVNAQRLEWLTSSTQASPSAMRQLALGLGFSSESKSGECLEV